MWADIGRSLVARAQDFWRRNVVDPRRLPRTLAAVGVAIVFEEALRILLFPIVREWSTMGYHDWDSEAAYRYITVLSLKQYHEFPWYHPWLHGGFPAWAYVEGVTNLVSPYFPLYMLLPLTVAMRLEVWGDAILGLVSMYLLAGRFTRSHSVRALAGVVGFLNTRWTLQMSVGHCWHQKYAWVPLALYLFDRGLEAGQTRFAVYSGIVLALIIYTGGIYPITHAALLLVVYAVVVAVATRRVRPVAMLALSGFSAVGLAAPKFIPILDLMKRFPREVTSTEMLSPGEVLDLFLSPGAGAHGVYGWHEYGIYIGAPALLAVLAGLLFARGARPQAVRLAGILFFVLGFGAFHKYAPWTLLHKVPVFASQHVSSRFLYMAVLLGMTAFAALFGKWLDRRLERPAWAWLDLAMIVPVLVVTTGLERVGRQTTEHVFYLAFPEHIEPSREFTQLFRPRVNYTPPGETRTGPIVLSMMANDGFIDCDCIPAGEKNHGAIATTETRYRGEAYLSDGTGVAHVVSRTVNTAVVEYSGAGPNALLVLNVNYDPSWKANGRPAEEYETALAAKVVGSAGRVVFRYRPRTLGVALAIFSITVLALLAPAILRWRRRRYASSARATAKRLSPNL